MRPPSGSLCGIPYPRMHNELTNLLPAERQKTVARNYFLRFGVVAVWFVSALAFVAMLLLIPTYVLLINSVQVKQNYLSSANSSVSPAEVNSLSGRLATLNANVASLAALAKAPSVSALLQRVLAIPRPGITLSNFTYTPASPGKLATLVVSGTSATRDALRNYQLALQNAPFSQSAALPVSAYAKDSDIGFSITITLAP